MKAHTLVAILASSLWLPAAEVPQEGMKLSNGMRIVVENGKVRVEGPAGNTHGATTSSSSSVSVRSEGGVRIATVVTERNGVREVRTITIGPDGKATAGEAVPDSDAGAPAPQAGGAWLGVNCSEVPPALRAQLDISPGEGLLVEHLAPGGPAAKAGLIVNDILLALDKQAIGSLASLREKLAASRPGQPVLVDYLRKGRRDTLRLALAERTVNQPSPTGEAVAKVQEQQPSTNTKSRTAVVGADGKATVVEGTDEDAFDAILKDPNVPESFKEQIRKQRDMMRKFREEHRPSSGQSRKPGL